MTSSRWHDEDGGGVAAAPARGSAAAVRSSCGFSTGMGNLGTKAGREGGTPSAKARQGHCFPVTAVKHGTEADLSKDSGNINDKVEKG